MRGRKRFQPKLFYNFSLDAAVPDDDFYRKLQKAVDLSWVHDRVAHRYAQIGRPSIDPVVVVKIELIGYLEGITSERQLMRQITDRLSLRRYIGYDLDEPVPDHSTLSRARDLLGRDLFQEVFDHSVRLCQAAGMVGDVHCSVDRSLIEADAAMSSLVPRVVPLTPKEHVQRLFAENPVPADCEDDVVSLSEYRKPPAGLPVIPGQPDAVGAPQTLTENEGGQDKHPPAEQEAEADNPDSTRQSDSDADTPCAQGESQDPRQAAANKGEGKEDKPNEEPPASNATHISRTDPDAAIASKPGVPPRLSYSVECWTDSRRGVITHADAFRATIPEHATVVQGLRRQRSELGMSLPCLSADKGYGKGRLYRQLNGEHVVGYIPYQKRGSSATAKGLYGLKEFEYDSDKNEYRCPGGGVLSYSGILVDWPAVSRVWAAKAADCRECQLREKCTKSPGGRHLSLNIYQAEYEEMAKRVRGRGGRLAAIARRTGPEPRFGEAKRWRGMRRAKYRGLDKVRGQVLLTAAAQNLKKYVNWVWRRGSGVGRQLLSGAAQRMACWTRPPLTTPVIT